MYTPLILEIYPIPVFLLMQRDNPFFLWKPEALTTAARTTITEISRKINNLYI